MFNDAADVLILFAVPTAPPLAVPPREQPPQPIRQVVDESFVSPGPGGHERQHFEKPQALRLDLWS